MTSICATPAIATGARRSFFRRRSTSGLGHFCSSEIHQDTTSEAQVKVSISISISMEAVQGKIIHNYVQIEIERIIKTRDMYI